MFGEKGQYPDPFGSNWSNSPIRSNKSRQTLFLKKKREKRKMSGGKERPPSHPHKNSFLSISETCHKNAQSAHYSSLNHHRNSFILKIFWTKNKDSKKITKFPVPWKAFVETNPLCGGKWETVVQTFLLWHLSFLCCRNKNATKRGQRVTLKSVSLPLCRDIVTKIRKYR